MTKILATELFNAYTDSDLLPLPAPLEGETVEEYVRRVPESTSELTDPLFSLLLLEFSDCDRATACSNLQDGIETLTTVQQRIIDGPTLLTEQPSD
jgi:hypothetical protein